MHRVFLAAVEVLRQHSGILPFPQVLHLDLSQGQAVLRL
jgi:hypothetical protein